MNSLIPTTTFNDIFSIFLIIGLFSLTRYSFYYYFNKNYKLGHNVICLIHACGCCLLSLNVIYNQYKHMEVNFSFSMLRWYSTSYFILDLIYCTRLKNSLGKWLIMYHHIISSYILFIPSIYSQAEVLFIGELSNIPSYILFYYSQLNNKVKVTYWNTVYKYVYTIIRVPIMGFILYIKLTTSNNPTFYYSGIPIYILGLLWSFRLLLS